MSRSIMKATVCCALAMILTCTGMIAYAEEYLSISDIRMYTPARWTETYETQWRTITIDAPITVPAVDSFPVIKIRQKVAVDDSLLAIYPIVENYIGYLNLYSDKSWYQELGYGANVASRNMGWFDGGVLPDLLPEDNTMTFDAALQVGLDEIERLFGIGYDSLCLRYVSIDRLYTIKKQNGERIYIAPYGSQPGSYTIYMDYLFDGIPMKSATNCYGQKNKSENRFVDAYAAFTVISQDTYAISCAFYDVIETPFTDIPICSFADAKSAIEQEIMAGHLRSIDEMRLCYIPYSDKDYPDVIWLLPAWYTKGAYTRNAEKDFVANYDDGLYIDDGMEHLEVVYQANIGKLIDYNESTRNRRQVPRVVTWDDVQ